MNQLLCAAIAVLLIVQGISAQVSEEENRKLRERICNDPFHSFLCQTVDPTKRKRYNAKPPESGGNLFGDNSFPQQSRILPPQISVPTTTVKPNVVLKTTLKPAQYLSPAQNILSAQNLVPQAAQNAPVVLKPKLSEDDLCKHSFHSFLCSPAKNHKRRLYNGQKSGPPPPNSNLLNGENSFLLPTQLRPDPPKIAPEPKIEPDNSNDSPVFQAPTYLPPFAEKPEQNLFGDNSFLDPSIQLLPTTAKPQPTTPRATTPRPTPRATTPRPTTPRPTTPRPTTPRATTPRPTTPRPTTLRATTTTTRPITARTKTEPSLVAAGAQNSGTQLRPEVTAENLCAHSFHSFLCDKPKQTKPRRKYNGRKSTPEDTNILGENSFQQPSRLLAPTTQAPKTTAKPPRTYAPYKPVTRRPTTPKPSSNLIGDNSFLSPTNLLPPTPQKPVTISTTPRPTTRPIPATQDPEVQPDAAQSPSVRLLPVASGTDDELCKHSFHSFLCTGGKTGGKRRVYNGQNSNILGASSFLDSKRLLPPSVQSARTTTFKPLFQGGSFIQSTNLRPELLNTAANTYLPPASYLPPQSKRSLRLDPNTANLFGASSNVDVTSVLPPPTSKPLPASLARGNHAPTTAPPPHTTEAEVQPAAAEDAPSVVVPEPEHHAHPPGGDQHHHDDAHAHDANHGVAHAHGANHGDSTHAHGDHHHGHGHGDHHAAGDHHHGAHGDHHHHHPLDNLSLEQLCRDPFHAFLCENVDTSKRRIYDGNPAQGTPSARDRPQGLQGASSDTRSKHVNAPRNNGLQNSLPNSVLKSERPRSSAQPSLPHSPNPVTLPPQRDEVPSFLPVATRSQVPYSSPDPVVIYTTTTRAPFIIDEPSQHNSQNENTENLSLYIRRDNPILLGLLKSESYIADSQRTPVESTHRERTPPQVPGAHLLQQPVQRLPVHRRRDPVPDTVPDSRYPIPQVPGAHLLQQPVQRLPVHRRRGPVPDTVPDSSDSVPQVPGAHLLQQPGQRLPVHRQRNPVPDTASPQVGNRERRPLRRKARPHSVNPEAQVNNQEYRFREDAPNPESVNRRSDDVRLHEETPRQIKFGERLPRRKRLNSQEADLSIETPTNPAGFVRGPRGVASYLAATTPDVQCKEPFSAYRCQSGSLRVKRMAKRKEEKEEKEDRDEKDERKENEKEDKEREKAEKEERKEREKAEKEERKRVRSMRRRGNGNMRDQAQGHESESGRGKPKAGQRMSNEEDTEDADKDGEVEKDSDEEEMEEVSEKHETMEDPESDKKTTTEDPMVVYQRGIDEELKRREEDAKNRKDELKRREDELEKRKEEMTRRNKEQEGRKAEAKRRKDESERRKAEERIRKEMLKRKKEQDKLDDEDADEAVEDVEDDDEEKKESEEKEKMRVANEKISIAELIRREGEVTRREGELKRREDELKRREEDGKSREAELKRRNDQEKKNAEELVRRDEEKVRIAEEMTRREEEDERRAAAKEKIEAAKRTK